MIKGEDSLTKCPFSKLYVDVTFTGLILKKFAKSSIDTQSPTARGVGMVKSNPEGLFCESTVYYWFVAKV